MLIMMYAILHLSHCLNLTDTRLPGLASFTHRRFKSRLGKTSKTHFNPGKTGQNSFLTAVASIYVINLYELLSDKNLT